MKRKLKKWLAAGIALGALGCVEENEELVSKPGPERGPAPATVDRGDDRGPDPLPGATPPSTKPGTTPGTPSGTPADPGLPADPGAPAVAKPPEPAVPAPAVAAKLVAAVDCSDLLTKIQDDAIAKLKMQVELYKNRPPPGPRFPGGVVDAGVARPVELDDAPVPAAPPSTPTSGSASGSIGGGKAAAPESSPTGASTTNTQVGSVDEADFVKVVDSGKGIFLLHGSSLHKLKSWPAAETALVGEPLQIEGSPSEMFASDQGKAVIFSQVHSYGAPADPLADPPVGGGAKPAIAPCPPGGGVCGGYQSQLKITVADLSGETPKVERELYYEGQYLSSRRYDSETSDVVRTVIQAPSRHAGLYSPDIEWTDAWGKPYGADEIASQLEEWAARTIGSIRKTTLKEWIPTGSEQRGKERVAIEPTCNSYFVPEAGLADYGLTHVLALDIDKPSAPVGGVTIVGASSTVYSNAERLVLAQPDYRWSPTLDFGMAGEQRTALHVFDLAAAETDYVASGWVFGALPPHNPQFGIDVAKDGTIRVATTGMVRDQPLAKPQDPAFWAQHPENYVITARPEGSTLQVVGKSEKLGKPGESVQSARFVGDRAYVVTFRRIDPLIVLDLAKPEAPTVLGELEIPGFSQYMHPLDDTHLVTLGQGATGGIQLQLFDVSNPKDLPKPKTLDFGSGTSSEVSYNHKAFTLYKGLLAIPLSGYGTRRRGAYVSGLELVKVDASEGFEWLGSIDHARLYADNGRGVNCGVCDALGCYDYVCSYAPEVRRGHFVEGDEKTFVYSFSHAGVLVHDLASLTRPLVRVGLPAPVYPNQPWYVTDGPLPAPRPAVPSSAGSGASADAGVATAR